ncbi:hypothetical protein [Streptomyces sp. URMC 123]|uniref:hypothetical protein n=1 Tax=Streptomyces sp. URMC 123 TaxID=3423403 RepID=UPI003F1940B1
MRCVHRVLTTVAAALLLAAAGAAMAPPAQADVHAELLNGTASVGANAAIGAEAFGQQLVNEPNPLSAFL